MAKTTKKEGEELTLHGVEDLARGLNNIIKLMKTKTDYETLELKLKKEESNEMKDITKQLAEVAKHHEESEKFYTDQDKQLKESNKKLKIKQAIWKSISDEIRGIPSMDGFKPLEGITSSIGRIFRAGWAAPLQAAFEIVNGLWKIFAEIELNVDEVAKQLGVGVSFSRQFAVNSVSLSKNYASLGISISEANQAAQSLVDTFVNYDYVTQKSQENITLITKGTGDVASNVTKALDTFMLMQGSTLEASEDIFVFGAELAKASKVPIKAVMADMAGSAQAAAKYGGQFTKEAVVASVMARKIGLSFADIAASADKSLDIENSVNAQFEASVLLNKDLNMEQLRYYALVGNTKGVMQEQLKLIGTEREWTSYNTIQRQALADALGLSVANVGKMVSRGKEAKTVEEQALEIQTKQAKTFEGLAKSMDIMVGGVTRLEGALKEAGYAFLEGLGFPISELGKDSNAIFTWMIKNVKELEGFARDAGKTIRGWYDSAMEAKRGLEEYKYIIIGVGAALLLVYGTIKAISLISMVRMNSFLSSFSASNTKNIVGAGEGLTSFKGALGGAMKLFGQAAVILAFGVAIKLVAESLKLLSDIPYAKLAQGVEALAVMFGVFIGTMALLSLMSVELVPAALILIAFGAATALLAGSLWIGAKAVEVFVDSAITLGKFLKDLDTDDVVKIGIAMLGLSAAVAASGLILAAFSPVLIVAGVALTAFGVGVGLASAAMIAADVAIAGFGGAMMLAGKGISAFKKSLFGSSKEELAASVVASIDKLLDMKPNEMDRISQALKRMGPAVGDFIATFSLAVGDDMEDKADSLNAVIEPMSKFIESYNKFVGGMNTKIDTVAMDANKALLIGFGEDMVKITGDLKRQGDENKDTEFLWGVWSSKSKDTFGEASVGISTLADAMVKLQNVDVTKATKSLKEFTDYLIRDFDVKKDKAGTLISDRMAWAFSLSEDAKTNIKDFKDHMDFSNISKEASDSLVRITTSVEKFTEMANKKDSLTALPAYIAKIKEAFANISGIDFSGVDFSRIDLSKVTEPLKQFDAVKSNFDSIVAGVKYLSSVDLSKANFKLDLTKITESLTKFDSIKTKIDGIKTSVSELNTALSQSTSLDNLKEITISTNSETTQYYKDSLDYLRIIAGTNTIIAEKLTSTNVTKKSVDSELVDLIGGPL